MGNLQRGESILTEARGRHLLYIQPSAKIPNRPHSLLTAPSLASPTKLRRPSREIYSHPRRGYKLNRLETENYPYVVQIQE